ncbi:MAG: adenylyltransferase/cytidyltransferase family protein [Pseudomonadales bacterium]|jgi:D-beta-D-heptose 7-phosphate kinase/D-beta-D-heptose 1-phosphate adenosyltransferase|nr:adenylyltransferase/cytidyltransferase family protein [Pseudomonadales bacterium]
MSTFEKIHVEPKSLLPKLAALREQGKTIVFGNGCFDLVHVGHIRYIEAARELGDLLVIAVNTEASIRANVGREKPINPCEKRMEVMAALEAVDFVIPLEDATPIALLELLRPDIQAKGTDYSLDAMPERETVEKIGGRIAFVGDEKQHSSTELRRILRERGAL